MTRKGLAYLILFAWVAYVLALNFYYPLLEQLASTPNVIQNFFFYFISEPHLLLIFFGVVWYAYQQERTGFGLAKGVVAGFFLSVALDQCSAPFCVTSLANFQSGINQLCSDTIVFKVLLGYMSFEWAKIVYYIITPIMEVVIALWLLTPKGFITEVKGLMRAKGNLG